VSGISNLRGSDQDGRHSRILDGPLQNMCPVIPTSNQDVRQAKLRKRGDEIKTKSSLKLLSQSQPNFAEMILGWSPSKNLVLTEQIAHKKIFMGISHWVLC
jgi:hypothetical protein